MQASMIILAIGLISCTQGFTISQTVLTTDLEEHPEKIYNMLSLNNLGKGDDDDDDDDATCGTIGAACDPKNLCCTGLNCLNIVIGTKCFPLSFMVSTNPQDPSTFSSNNKLFKNFMRLKRKNN
ncbi:uncharacterized protein LOC111707622 [Eurytemora carolleeae]|uniref:uncharacterized protein LOC111707622 n=1 Tax=Eurytemora carolleeae TaxID=1294199 RepID=UPI000C75A5B5|nr:uncharacterized protein LOC111707622 [Eurytemora carolleeae]|eukprot:XP_023336522.1 uncharacterized protein LOC111707622 [Eurytemora affinis]